MSASLTDKITDIRNAARPNSARVTSGRSAGGATLACDNLSGWPTTSKVHFVTYKIDSSEAVVAGSQLDCYGIVSGNNIGSFTVVDGTDTGHAVGDVVEMLPTAAWGQDQADALIVGHTRTGAHAANLPLTTPVLTTPTIADFTSANHTHATTAQGGAISNVLMSNPYKFSVYRSAALNSGNGAFAKVTFDTKIFDTGSNFDAVTNNRFTAPIAGFYQFNAHVSTASAVSLWIISFYKNGSEFSRGTKIGVSVAVAQGVSHSDLIQLSAGEYIEVFAFSSGTVAYEVGASAPHPQFSGFLVSAS